MADPFFDMYEQERAAVYETLTAGLNTHLGPGDKFVILVVSEDGEKFSIRSDLGDNLPSSLRSVATGLERIYSEEQN